MNLRVNIERTIRTCLCVVTRHVYVDVDLLAEPYFILFISTVDVNAFNLMGYIRLKLGKFTEIGSYSTFLLEFTVGLSFICR